MSERKATVTLFRPSGAYYTIEEWAIPDGAVSPRDMTRSPDFRRIEGGPVLVHEEAFGYPGLLLLDVGSIQLKVNEVVHRRNSFHPYPCLDSC